MNPPAEGVETDEWFKRQLLRKAVGYEVEEFTEIDGEHPSTIRKLRHVPGDLKALELYRKIYGDGVL